MPRVPATRNHSAQLGGRPARRIESVVDERDAREVRRPANGVRPQQRAARHRRHELAEQRVGGRPVEAAAPESDRNIHVVLVEVERPRIRPHSKLDSRDAARQARQTRHQPPRREGRSRADREPACPLSAAQHSDADREQLESLAQVFRRELTLVGEGEAPRPPAEELHAQVPLESTDLVADRRRRHVQLARGAGEAQKPRGRFESAQGRERRKRFLQG